MKRLGLLLGLLLICMAAPFAASASGTVAAAALPREARETLALIEHGGPYRYSRDDVVFGNYERRLPSRPRGYYHEFTVPTPGLGNRGPRRIISGAGGDRYYSEDHYLSFRRVVP